MTLLAVPAIVSAAYHAFAFFCAIRKLRERAPVRSFYPPVSLLKPVKGTDEGFARAIRSHACQDYPEFEILFGVQRADDSAVEEIQALQRAYPAVPVRLLITPSDAPNGKVGTLEQLASEAKHDVLIVNDSDIVVGPSYIQEVVAPLANETCGLVTCLYRGAGGSTAARFEALGIATEFAPSVLVAREIGVNEFAMGSTLALRARDLERIGGFRSIRDFIADDYQLGKRLTGLGREVVLGRPVVETWLGSGSWTEVWRHQVRWARTIRLSRAGGYFGYAITHAACWCLLAAVAGFWRIAVGCYLVRAAAGLSTAGLVLRDRQSLRRFWWLPARDLFGFAVWLAGLAGGAVEWRGQRLVLDAEGRIRQSRG